MMRKIIFMVCLLSVSVVWAGNKPGSFLEQYMKENNFNGTVVIESLKTGKIHVYNNKRAKKGYLPASTFKIVNTLIALQENAVRDENEVIKWDGKEKGMPDWNKDQNLKSAFPLSCVWFYQELAKKIGKDRYISYFRKMKYGNMRAGTNLDSFWLDGGLRISAAEQIAVLKNIYNEKYDFDKKNYVILKDLMIVDKNENYIVRAKTGFATRVTPNIGWYVGYIETKDDTWFFASNMDILKAEHLKFRKEMVYKAFKELEIIESER